MVKSATELKAGDVIRFEYGDYDNWAECTVKEAVTVGNTVNVKGSRMGMNYELEFGPTEKVQVLQNGETEI